MATAFKQTELFGGAIVVDLPEGYADVSTIRQVPDHQEVYLHTTGLTSLIFDITERITHLSSDEEALQYHLEDIIESSSSSSNVKIWSSNSAIFSKLPPNTPAYTLLATTSTAPSSPSSLPSRSLTPAFPFTAIILTLIRLAPQSTDLVISVNIPHLPDEPRPDDSEPINFEEGKVGKMVEKGISIRDRILKSFEIRDWGLFGEVEEEEEVEEDKVGS
ncbi:hypothetical protein MMC06_001236 [Schaereria dolodes]|nr:hypothetical protein [Schaereria dolodes]